MTSYHARAGLFSGEQRYHLTEHELWVESPTTVTSFDFDEIESLRLTATPQAPGFVGARCIVRSQSGEEVMIPAAHWVRWGVVEDRSSTFFPFARELLERVAMANQEATFAMGRTMLSWLLWCVLLLALGLTLVIGGIGMACGELPLISAPPLVALAATVPMAYRVVREGYSRPFHPFAIRSGVLPG